MKTLKVITLVTSMLVWHGVSHAEQNEPDQGRIDFLNLKKSNIVVNDFSYNLAPGYVVKDSKGKVISAFNLKKGQTVEVYTTGSKNLVSEIVIVK